MADNIAVTEGSGKTVATDDVGGIQMQVIKVAVGASGTGTYVVPGSAFPVQLNDTGTTPAAVDALGQLLVKGQITDTGGTLAVTNAQGHLNVVQYDSSGNEITSIAVVEDAALSGGESGILAMGKYVATPSQSAGTANDATQPIYGDLGKLWADGGVSGIFQNISINPEDTGSGYATNDVIGGKQTISSASRAASGTGTILSAYALIEDTGATWTASDVDLWFFNDTGGTYNDHNAFSLAVAEMTNFIDVMTLDESYTVSGATVLRGQKNIAFTADANSAIYVVPVARASSPVFDGDTGGVVIGGTWIRD